MSSLFTELKRRNVMRVGAAYLVGGWILIQVADALFPALNLPDWSTRFVAGLVVLGFPVALLLAWAFEVTPGGVKRDSEIADAVRESGKRLDIATILGVVLVIAIIGYQQTNESPSNATDDAIQQPAAESTPPSIAVLAFENMSPDPENAYFAEGISEEILNVLTKVDGLHVASRTSAFSFANTNTPIPEIASQLNVNHVLEGSVRKQNTRVRITAQLIDAGTDKHLWSATYDRELDDIFAVQSEIATAITQALMGALGMQQVIVDAPTKDLVAYELFLSGRKFFYQRGAGELARSIVDLSAAVARDPEFAEAWSFLAAAQSTSTGYGIFSDAEMQERNSLASEAAAKALELDPNQALAVAIQGQVLAFSDYLAGIEKLRQAVAMAPNDAGLHMWLADKLFRIAGNLKESLPLYERAVELDPLSGINQGLLGIAYLMAGEREKGRAYIRRANAAGWGAASGMLVIDLLHTGEGEQAVELIESQLLGIDNESFAPDNKEQLLSIWRRIATNQITGDEIEEFETKIITEDPDFGLRMEYLAVGDLPRYFDRWLSKGKIGQQYFELRFSFTPAGRVLVEHPRFLDTVEYFNILPVWEALGYPMGCERVQDDIGDHLSCPGWPE